MHHGDTYFAFIYRGVVIRALTPRSMTLWCSLISAHTFLSFVRIGVWSGSWVWRQVRVGVAVRGGVGSGVGEKWMASISHFVWKMSMVNVCNCPTFDYACKSSNGVLGVQYCVAAHLQLQGGGMSTHIHAHTQNSSHIILNNAPAITTRTALRPPFPAMGSTLSCLAQRQSKDFNNSYGDTATLSPAHSLRKRCSGSLDQQNGERGPTLQDCCLQTIARSLSCGRLATKQLSVLPIDLLQRVIDEMVEQGARLGC